jgi:hypothetical protein
LHWYGQDKTFVEALDWINFVFTVIFLLEAICKIIAYRKKYFHDRWNRFDFTIVVISVLDFILTFFVSTEFLVIITLFRIFRIARVLRLIKSAKSLRVIFATFYLTLPSIVNIGSLLLLFVYIFTIMGV